VNGGWALEWWIARVRLLAIPFAVLQVWATSDYPARYEAIAWGLTGVLAVGAVGLFFAVRAGPSRIVQAIAMAPINHMPGRPRTSW